MKRLHTLILAIVLLATPAAWADHYADFYVIPVASHTPGLNGTMWMSDVAIQNFQTSDLTVQLFLVETGLGTIDNVFPLEGPNGEVTVKAGGSVILKDVLNGYRGNASAIGSILVGADRPFALTSRSYSMAPSGDTVGQTVLPARDFINNSIGDTNNAMATAYVPGLVWNDRFRTNVGFVAGTANSDMTVEIRLKGEDGATLGTKSYTVRAGYFVHAQFPVTELASAKFNAGGLEFRIVGGDGAVIPYASVIDNGTADAVFVSGNFPPNASFGKVAERNVFRDVFDRMKK
jgi:hypothetical protein